MGIPVKINSPQVGLNLRDKLTFAAMGFIIPNTSLNLEGPIPGIFYNDGVGNDGRSVNTVTYFVPLKTPNFLQIGIDIEIIYTTCSGSVRLLDKDPLSEVKFRMDCFHPGPGGTPSIDILHQLAAFKDTRRMMATLHQILGQPVIEVQPGYGVVPPDATDQQIIQYILASGSVAFQPGGTCRVGTSIDNSVVDEHMMVWGTSNLRIVDISVIPIPMQGPPTGGAMAIAERISAEIKALWK